MTTLKTFKIGIWEETGGYVEIKAKTRKRAEAIAQEILDEEGLDGFDSFRSTHRDCYLLDCEEA
jgi:hypothetical protein